MVYVVSKLSNLQMPFKEESPEVATATNKKKQILRPHFFISIEETKKF